MKKLLILFAFLALAITTNARNFVCCVDGKLWIGTYSVDDNGDFHITVTGSGTCTSPSGNWCHTWALINPNNNPHVPLAPQVRDLAEALSRAHRVTPATFNRNPQSVQIIEELTEHIRSGNMPLVEIPVNMVNSSVASLGE